MTLLAVPNVSEGRDTVVLNALRTTVERAGALVLDIHTDARHNRTVLTLTGKQRVLVDSCVELAAEAARAIDLRKHDGIHPRLGALDVCPFVPFGDTIENAVEAAETAAERIGRDLRLPVYLYGAAARRMETRELPLLRRGGLDKLIVRSREGLTPDTGPLVIDERTGVVCVGARGPLVAFNVWLESNGSAARSIAEVVRGRDLRALGLELGRGRSQVSMNLIAPETTGIEDAFGLVAKEAGLRGVRIAATEIVGVPEARFLPAQDTEVARLLMEPGHSLEDLMERLS